MLSSLYDSYLSDLISGNKKGCTEIVERLIEHETPVYELYTGLFQRSMYEVGQLWQNNQISVAVEHMATAVTEGLLNLVYPIIFSADHIDRSAIVCCTPNEYHQLGAKMAADIFELNGWDSYFLGANTPTHDLLCMIEEKKPDLLGLSVSLYFSIPYLIETIEVVSASFPNQEIVVGGQAFSWGGKEKLSGHPQVNIIDSIITLETVTKEY
ncbi:methyltransferase cognate corrinoid protein, Methanosarcina family [Limihaloglobus sulfuriphilus]|uniref:Methyltransferase cognate corrinoid protein, Methanosarcina family n=1 Tax=Limihaloglobus sulfuriphilus TaxID=1851148 RepID=A0A1Q2MEL7_9BACT|nr:B12-binding domain-containing protein [Limihaloglobus sulfuriphilus]AQQ70682.1 methyltransferase cognate corrinoid protein, Methanosarcina family [Limihaloglobus sulfuriphilus]